MPPCMNFSRVCRFPMPQPIKNDSGMQKARNHGHTTCVISLCAILHTVYLLSAFLTGARTCFTFSPVKSTWRRNTVGCVSFARPACQFIGTKNQGACCDIHTPATPISLRTAQPTYHSGKNNNYTGGPSPMRPCSQPELPQSYQTDAVNIMAASP